MRPPRPEAEACEAGEAAVSPPTCDSSPWDQACAHAARARAT
ncbi:MAG: hypothetical protein ACK55Z_24615 [bacterium]